MFQTIREARWPAPPLLSCRHAATATPSLESDTRRAGGGTRRASIKQAAWRRSQNAVVHNKRCPLPGHAAALTPAVPNHCDGPCDCK